MTSPKLLTKSRAHFGASSLLPAGMHHQNFGNINLKKFLLFQLTLLVRSHVDVIQISQLFHLVLVAECYRYLLVYLFVCLLIVIALILVNTISIYLFLAFQIKLLIAVCGNQFRTLFIIILLIKCRCNAD